MKLSCCIWALSGLEEEMLTSLASIGFKWIDIRPLDLLTESAQTKARQLGLGISCIGASFGLPPGLSLDHPDGQVIRQALDYTRKSLTYGAGLGATVAYIVPSLETLSYYTKAVTSAADEAASLGLKLCIEHFPGKALPTAAETLDFIRDIAHPNLYLLFDIGHIQMSGEDPVATIEAAGAKLGYVHLDDNNGRDDQHLSLLDGVLTEATLRRTLAALAHIGYSGAISLELNPTLPDPLTAIKQSYEIVMRCLKEH
jgi:sugar phosphate isomerase/epimerase